MSLALSTLMPSTPMPAAKCTKSRSGPGQIHLLIGMLRPSLEVLPPDVHIVLEDAVLAVCKNDEHDRELVVSRRPQRLDAVHRRAVAGDGDDRAIGHCDLDADRAGKSLADAAAAPAEIVAEAAIVERPREVEARGDAFVDDDDIVGQAAPELGRHPRHRARLAVPALLQPRPVRLSFARAQLGQRLVAALRGELELGACAATRTASASAARLAAMSPTMPASRR